MCWVHLNQIEYYSTLIMRQIIKDWCNFCEGRNDFDESHFYTLFWDDSEDEKLTMVDLQIIFSYFLEKDKLFEILNNYLFDTGEKIDASKEDLIFLAREDVREKAKLSEELYYLFTKSVIFDEDFQKVEASRDESEYLKFNDEVSDVLFESWKLEDGKAYALYEALYGLTKDYKMVWYLFSPLLDVDINFDNYFKMKINNGIYSITNNKIVVSREPLRTNPFL